MEADSGDRPSHTCPLNFRPPPQTYNFSYVPVFCWRWCWVMCTLAMTRAYPLGIVVYHSIVANISNIVLYPTLFLLCINYNRVGYWSRLIDLCMEAWIIRESIVLVFGLRLCIGLLVLFPGFNWCSLSVSRSVSLYYAVKRQQWGRKIKCLQKLQKLD